MLRLTIIKSPPDEMPVGETLVVGPAGAKVGRAAENNWTLSDRELNVSRNHFAVLYENGQYLVLDTSANGTFIDDNVQPLGRGQKAPVENGSRIRLGDYVLKVSLEIPSGIPVPPIGGRPAFLPPQQQPGEPEVAPRPPQTPYQPEEAHPAPSLFPNIEPQPLEENPFGGPFDKSGSRPSADDPSTAFRDIPLPGGTDRWSPNHVTPPTPFPASPPPPGTPPGRISGWERVTPPPVNPALPEEGTPASSAIVPDDWYLDPDVTAGSTPIPVAPPPPAPRPAAPPAPPPPVKEPARERPVSRDQTTTPAHESLDPSPLDFRLRQALSAALGPHTDTLPTQDLIRVVEEMASMIALSIPELMRALASRSQFKEHLRLNQTMVRARDNNPLKFCNSTDEALEHMLLNDHPGLLNGKLAMEQAFRELAAHQTALVAALQPSLRETLEKLSPASIEAFVGSEGIAGFALPKGKGKLWDTYLEIYMKLAESERGTLEQNFMRSLGKYYERSLNALK